MAYPILPLVGVGLAASAAGAGLQIAGAQESSNAMNNAVNQEVADQQQYQQQGHALAQQSLAQSTPQVAKNQIAQGQLQRLQDYQGLQGTPNLVNNNSQIQSPSYKSQDTARSGLLNSAQAGLQGYSEWDLQQAIKDMNINTLLGVNQGFAQNRASILPYQLRDAQQKGAGLEGIGSILGSVGGLVGGLGALGGLGAGIGTVGGEALPSAGASYILNPGTNLFQSVIPGLPGTVG